MTIYVRQITWPVLVVCLDRNYISHISVFLIVYAQYILGELDLLFID